MSAAAGSSRVQRPGPAEDVHAAAERRRAARALLLSPLVVGDGPRADEFRLVRRHREALERLFAEGLGYRLVVEPRAARLVKAGLGRDPGRPLRRPTRTAPPFTPRAYALLCLALAALTRCREQLLVDELVAQVRSAVTDAGLDVDLDAAADRRALHAALMTLVRLGVLRERDGDLARWGEDASAVSLLDVDRERLRLVVAAPLGGADGPGALLDTAALPSAAGGARVAVRRRLAESPVLSITDLEPDQAEWWARSRHREREWFRESFGLELELRAEGALAVDPDGELSDEEFPGSGSTRHAALLVLERLVAVVRDAALEAGPAERAWRPLPAGALDDALAQVRSRLGAALRRDHRDDPAVLRADVLAVLRAAGLLRGDDRAATDPDLLRGGLHLHAAAARYAPRPVLAATAGSGERSLFDDDPTEETP